MTVVVVVEEDEEDSADGVDPGLLEEKVEDSVSTTRIWSFLTHYSSS